MTPVVLRPLPLGAPVGCQALVSVVIDQPLWPVLFLMRLNSAVIELAIALSQVLGSGFGAGLVLTVVVCKVASLG